MGKIASLVCTAFVLGWSAVSLGAQPITCNYATACEGTNKADKLLGEGQNDIIGKGGNDYITSAGTSFVRAGSGKDKVRAFRSGNLVKGNSGDDTINVVNDGIDTALCGGGRDKVVYDGQQTDKIDGDCELRFPR